jgi:hypothetical protein
MSQVIKRCCVILILFVVAVKGFGQNTNFGNEWISYDKDYVRIGVMAKGLQKVNLADLPTGFDKSNPDKLQLWHRGKEIPLITADSKAIVFYGEPNNGSTDSAVFRPSTARLNPFVSLFSDESSYFLTTSDNNPKRVVKKDGANLTNTSSLSYHFAKDIRTFNNQFAFSTFGVDELLNNSFYQEANSPTSTTIWGPKASSQYVTGLDNLDVDISMKKFYGVSGVNPELELLINGLNAGAHDVQLQLGKNSNETSRNLIGTVSFSGYDGRKTKFTLDKDKLFGENGSGILRISSVSEDIRDWFGVSYVLLTYPQVADMTGLSSSIFNYRASDQKSDRINVSNIPANAELFDVSDPSDPVLILSKKSGSSLEAQVNREQKKELRLMVADINQPNQIPVSRIYPVSFNPVYASPAMANRLNRPKDYDFLMIAANTLESSSVDYAKYRSSAKGGSRKTFLMNIRGIYDEFNYGEPSPVAIRKYIAYMLSEGVRPDQHNLLLMGHSVTWPTRLVKEMPGEVPSLGDPGSDMLLVAGLNGSGIDIPAIPVGRINAFTNQEVINYLDKVETYEHESETAWRKNVLHLNGGHSAAEINQLKTLLSDMVPQVENGVIAGQVQAFIKRQGITETEKVNISTEVNNGVGMITYFGHGSQTITDLDMGYVSDATRGYSNSKKYPLMFFNGCGVGNIFASRLTHTLSSDWLLTANKGAIAIVSNSYKSYVSTSAKHLRELYREIFVNTEDLTIGQVLLEVAKSVTTSNANSYDIANLHQTYIQGDPSIVAVRSNKPDYSIAEEGGILLYSENGEVNIGNSKVIRTGAIISNGGRFETSQSVSLRFDYYLSDGSVKKFNREFTAKTAKDTVYHDFSITGKLLKIEVSIDPEDKIDESNKSNNTGVLDVDWEEAKTKFFYTGEVTNDILAPLLKVLYDGRMIENAETIVKGRDFKFTVEDDRNLTGSIDDFEMFLKPCGETNGCEFVRIPEDQLIFSQVSNRKYEVFYPTGNLAEGNYQLLIIARDHAGNTSENSFSLDFKIVDSREGLLSLLVSPNPATNYVMFKVSSIEQLTNWRLTIYDNLGREVKVQNSSESLVEGNVIYWTPEVSSGLYIYKFHATTSSNKTEERSGKIVIVK